MPADIIKLIVKQKPEGPYCQVIRMFWDSRSCPSLDESRGARHPFCLKLEKELDWDRAGHILKQCVDEASAHLGYNEQ
jgi:hypothetical protein